MYVDHLSKQNQKKTLTLAISYNLAGTNSIYTFMRSVSVGVEGPTNLVILWNTNVLIEIRSVEKETIDAYRCLQMLKIRTKPGFTVLGRFRNLVLNAER